MTGTRRYGWRRDALDARDVSYALAAPDAAIPDRVDLRPEMPEVYDQGPIGSCTGNACAAALVYARAMQGLVPFPVSRLLLYWDARALEGTTGADAGAEIRDVIKGAATRGACPEEEWPYDTAQVLVSPPPAAFDAALKDRAIGYRRVTQSEAMVEGALAAGDPIVFGFTVFESFESAAVAQSGIVPLPVAGEATVGGHAVVAVGYDRPARQIIVRNSWGAQWGVGGYCRMPYAYFFDPKRAADLWSIRLVTP